MVYGFAAAKHAPGFPFATTPADADASDLRLPRRPTAGEQRMPVSHRPRIRRQLRLGDVVVARTLTSVTGAQVQVPDPDCVVHLQFRRFAGCPICNLHLRSVVRRHDQIVAAGIREVVLFHTPEAELRRHIDGLPFAVVSDPDKRMYAEFGVESSPRALLNPRAWPGMLKGVVLALTGYLKRSTRPPKLVPHGGRLGLPADVLVAPDGRVLACKYGVHADDQWSVDELLEVAAATCRGPAPGTPPS
jgi:peroxiredoxin